MNKLFQPENIKIVSRYFKKHNMVIYVSSVQNYNWNKLHKTRWNNKTLEIWIEHEHIFILLGKFDIGFIF